MTPQDQIPPFDEWLKTRKPSPSQPVPSFEQFKASRATRARSRKHAEAEVARSRSEFEQARDALVSAGGKLLNPPVTSGTDYFRPLSTTEKAAQKRGEPVIISEAGAQIASVAPQKSLKAPQVPNPTSTMRPRKTGILEPGNIDVSNRPRVRNKNGSISTVRSFSANIDGREVLLPTVSDDGRNLTEKQAIEQYRRTGKHLGVFDNPASATAYAQKLHQDQARTLQQPPVSMAPVIQGRLEQIQREKRHRETQAKVAQARLVRERAGLVLPKGQRNQGQAYKPKFGLGETYREVPKLDKTIPNVEQMMVEQPLSFEQDRSQRTAVREAKDKVLAEARKRGIRPAEIRATVTAEMQRPEPYTDQFGTRVRLSTPDPNKVEAETLARTQAAIEEHDRKKRVSQMGNLEYAAQLPKGPLLGVASGAGTALKGLAVASRKIVDQITDTRGFDTRDAYVYQLGEAIEQNSRALLSSNPDLEKEFFIGKAPEALGQSALFLLGGWASKSPKLAISVLGGTMTAGDAYDEVRALGGTDEDAVNAGLLAGAILGPTELIGTRGLVKALEGTVHANTLRTALKTALATGSKEGLENAIQEVGQEAGQGLITGNPRSLGELAEAGALGGISGFVGTGATTLAAAGVDAVRSRPQNIVDEYLKVSPLSTSEEKAAAEKVAKVGQAEALPENLSKPLQTITETITPPVSEDVAKPRDIISEKFQTVPAEVSRPQPTVETPAEVNTQPTATESQLTTAREVEDATQKAVEGRVPAPTEVVSLNEVARFAPSLEEAKQATIPAKPVTSQAEVAPTSEERTPVPLSSEAQPPSKPADAARTLQDWGKRLKTIAEAKDLNALQSLSDEMAAQEGDPRVARLRTAIQDELARARQPQLEASPEAGNKITSEKGNLSKSQQKALAEAEAPEGKTMRPAPTHRVGAPKPDASRNTLEQQVRAYGGVKDDLSQVYKGELGWLKESAKRGTVNQTGGISVEEMATKLAQDGYGKGVWWEGAPNNVDPQAFLQAVMDDARGAKLHYSTERDEIEDDPDVKAWDALVEGAGKELIERVSSGRATAGDIVTLTREAQANGLSDRALDAFIASLQRTIQEELPKGTEEGQGYTLDQDGTLIDPEGNPLFARQLGFIDQELTPQEAPRLSETATQREQLRHEQAERDEAADPARAAALRVLAEIKRRGMSIDEYARQGNLFGAGPSAEEIAYLKEVERSSREATAEQARMFAKGEPTLPSPKAVEVTRKGNRVILDNRAAVNALNAAYKAMGHEGPLAGAFEKSPIALANQLEDLGYDEMVTAVREAAKDGNGKVLLATLQTERHEAFHEASEKGYGSLKGRHGDFDTLVETPEFTKMYYRLVAMGYPKLDMGVLVEEAAAHIAEGRYEQLGLTREEAVDWMYKWFQSFEKANPDISPREFQELADAAYEAREKAYREARQRQPQPDQAISRLQERREGGDRESIAAARGRGDITETDAFKRWFGDSKVVDEEGKPLVVYHGTPGDFESFQTKPLPYFSSNPDRAAEFGGATSRMKGGEGEGVNVMPVYLSIKNPLRPSQLGLDYGGSAEKAKAAGYDGEIDYLRSGEIRYRPFDASQIKSATGNRGTFDPNDPNILFARSGDPWSNLSELSAEFGRLANEPELAEGEKPLSLPQTLADAGLEAGPARGYLPESIQDDGVERAKQVIADKGIDGAIEFVKSGDGIEWASTGYEVSARLREEESKLRAEGKAEEADKTRDKRLNFLDDFALAATERGRSVVGIKAISIYAPDRMAFNLNRVSRKGRKQSISAKEEANITDIGDRLGELEIRNQELEKRLAEATARAKKRTDVKAKTKKTDYQTRLEQQAATVLQTLKPKLGKFDLSGLEREAERGAVKIGIPPLTGDSELIAQYAAAQLAKLTTVQDLNQHLIQEFGQDIEQYLPRIRQRAYAIRQEARMAEIEASETEPKRRKTILSEIQKEISESLQTIRETQKAQERARKEEKAAERKSERLQAISEAKAARAQESEARKQQAKEARADLKRLRIEYKQASQAETKGYRETIKAQREAERKAELWDTPLRNAAAEARERLRDATDPNDPQTAEDLIAVAAEKFLPPVERNKDGSVKATQPGMGATDPARVYRDLKDEFPNLVTKKNQGDLYKKGYQRIQDATAAAREAARLRSATAESKRLWDELGIDVDAQAVLIQQAEVRRQTDELRRKAQAEFQRVSKTFIEKLWTELGAFPRALQSSIDAPLGRQGAFFLLTHPLETVKTAVPATLKGYGSIHVVDYIARDKELAQHPDYKLAIESGLELSQTASSGDPALVAEEQHQSPLASRIFPHVRLSEQGYVLGMNAQRLAIFSRLADIGRADGYTPGSNPEFFEAVARFVNDGTGRGNMPDFVKRASTLLNFFFFSTRLNISRLQLLNDLFNPVGFLPESANPLSAVPGFASYDPVMRKVVAKELVRLGISVGTVLLIASALGVKIEYDLDDPDALLLRVRNTRYDITGGEAGTIRFLYRFMRSIYRTAAEEKLEPYEQPLPILGKFLRYKLAPLPSGTIDALTGKDAVGQPANLKKFESPKQVIQENVIIKRTLPMMVGNVLDTVTEEGWVGIPMVLPAVAGFGVSSYPDRGIRAIKNQQVVDLLESLKITSNSLLGDKTKDDALDKEIQKRIMEKVETLEVPQGATEVGKEQIVKERLSQIRAIAKLETAASEPERYRTYLQDRDNDLSMSFLTDEEKKNLTEETIRKYRSLYADAYLTMSKNVVSNKEIPLVTDPKTRVPWSELPDDQKETIIRALGRRAYLAARVKLVEQIRPKK